jgi:protein-S-isoprenylcysteine O-methyltransferase
MPDGKAGSLSAVRLLTFDVGDCGLHPLPFSGGPIYVFIFWVTYALWIGLETIAWRIKQSGDRSKVLDRGSFRLLVVLLWVALALDFSLSFFVPRATIFWKRTTVFFIGIGLMLAGIAFRWYAMSILGRFFTFDVAVQSGQIVVDAGPYRYIRHPSYAGALITLVGLGLALGNWAGLFALVACMGIAYAYRISVEEAALVAALGEPYKQYAQRTRRIVPFLF